MTQTVIADLPLSQDQRAALVGQQNDQFRSAFGANFTIPGSVVYTPGVSTLAFAWQLEIMTKVMTFSEFEEGDVDHGFGAFEVTIEDQSEQFFWAITLYDNAREYGSPQPEDPKQTNRVLTIMLRSEY